MQKYKMNEVNQFKFLQIPKELFTNKCYRCALNSDAKLTYGLLLDRMHLSEKNNWCNDNGEIYLLYTKENVADMLGISPRTIYKSFKSLEECELICQERQGLNKPNKIYIGKFTPDFSRMCKICSSESANNAGQDMQNMQTNNTNLNKTNINNIEVREGVKPEGVNTISINSIPFYDYLNQLIKSYVDIEKDLKQKIYQGVIYYCSKYEEVFKVEHIRYKTATLKTIIKKLHDLYTIGIWDEQNGIMVGDDLSLEDFKVMVDKNFLVQFNGKCEKKMSYTLLSFLNDNVLIHRFYEELY